MPDQPFEPGELVVEFRSRLRIAVGQIDRGDDDAVDGGFDIAALEILGIARQVDGGQHRFVSSCEDCDAVPVLLAAPDCRVARVAKAASGKAACSAFNSCRQATSGLASSSHTKRFASRLLTLLMLKVAIFNGR